MSVSWLMVAYTSAAADRNGIPAQAIDPAPQLIAADVQLRLQLGAPTAVFPARAGRSQVVLQFLVGHSFLLSRPPDTQKGRLPFSE